MKFQSQIQNELQRTEAVAGVHVERHTAQRLRSVAQSLNRRGVAAAKLELVNSAMLAFVEVLFDTDPDGVHANLDPDGLVLIPAPFGRAGGTKWGLRNTEQRTFAHVMRKRSIEENAPLFVYLEDARRWYVGTGYTKNTALAYMRTKPISLEEWRAAWAVCRSNWAKQHIDR